MVYARESTGRAGKFEGEFVGVFADIGRKPALIEKRVLFWNQQLAKTLLSGRLRRVRLLTLVTRNPNLVFANHRAVVEPVGREREGSVALNFALSWLAPGRLERDAAEF